MNRIRLLAVATVLIFALTTVAQQDSGTSGGQTGAQVNSVPEVEAHVRLFTEKLSLTSDQQTKIRPILRDMHDSMQKIMEDESKSREEKLASVRPMRMKADKEIREILNDDQKKKLDQLEQEMHAELHGDAHGR